MTVTLGRIRTPLLAAVAASILAFSSPVQAGPIAFEVWYEFGVGDVGVEATGCDPDDPDGAFCIPSSGTPTQFLDAPPWTFTAPASGATLTVIDAFESTERFELFDFGVSLGLSSLPAAASIVDCGDDPLVCLGTPGMSRGSFGVSAGNHAITIVPTLSQFGAAYLQVSAAAVPEPGTLLLLGLALAGAVALRARSTRG